MTPVTWPDTIDRSDLWDIRLTETSKSRQKTMELVTAIYASTQEVPKSETCRLTGQMRRAAVSIPSNIAEGQGRRSEGDFQHFLRNARGSLLELETQVLIAQNLRYLSPAKAEVIAGPVRRGRTDEWIDWLNSQELTTSN